MNNIQNILLDCAKYGAIVGTYSSTIAIVSEKPTQNYKQAFASGLIIGIAAKICVIACTSLLKIPSKKVNLGMKIFLVTALFATGIQSIIKHRTGEKVLGFSEIGISYLISKSF